MKSPVPQSLPRPLARWGWGLPVLLSLTLLLPAMAQTTPAKNRLTKAAPTKTTPLKGEGKGTIRLTPTMTLGMTIATFKPVALRDLAGEKATVLVFMGTACPISNEYAPELRSLSNQYQDKGVRFVYVYPNAGTTQDEAQRHVSEFYKASMAVWDNQQKLTDAVGAKTTPEVAVLDASLTLRYRGQIDDRYVARAKAKMTGPSSRDLKKAVDAVLAGKPVPVMYTRATGCLIERDGNPTPAEPIVTAVNTPRETVPNYAEHIAPIIQQNCQSCHRAGEIGPMAFESYEQVRQYAANIVEVTQSKFMPPWKPIEGHGEFKNKRTLTEEQVSTIKRWTEAGTPAGDLTKMPKAPEFPNGWQLGTPDLVLTMPEKWTVAASGEDVYRCFVLPTNLKEDKQVVAVEYRAGNKRVVHHVLGFIDVAGEGRKLDAKEEGPGYTNFGGPGFLPYGELGGWAPGNMPSLLPDGIGRNLPAGSDVILQVHYHPTGKVEDDITQVGIYFAKKPLEKQLRIFPVAFTKLDIPPGEANYRVEANVPMLADADLLFVTPHMHLLGREVEMWATLPDGTVKPLIKIDDWDFRWQDNYNYKEPVRIPKGAKLTLKARYDNSTANPRNPVNPPRRVNWGEGTNDEMCIGFLGFVAANENDPFIKLYDAVRQKRKPQSSDSAKQEEAVGRLREVLQGKAP